MLQFLDLWFRNFQSYGNNVTHINLNNPGAYLIAGQNGVGKSTIFQALVYVLYNRVISSTKANESKVDELINNINKKQMQVTCTLFKKDAGYFKLERARKMKSGAEGNYIKIWFNPIECEFEDIHEMTLGGSGSNDKYIENLIGMPFDMFIRIVVVSANSAPFLDLPVSSTTQISQIGCMERLFNITILSEKGSKLKTLIKTTEDAIKLIKRDIEHLENSKQVDEQRRESLIKNAEKFDINRKNEIESLNSQLDKIKGVNIEEEKELHHELEDVTNSINILQRKQDKITSNIQIFTKENNKLDAEIKKLVDNTCPYCNQVYHDDEKLKQKTQDLIECKAQVEKFEQQLAEFNQSIKELHQEYDVAANKITIPNIEELINIKNKSEHIQQKIHELTHANNIYLEQLDDLKLQTINEVDYTELNGLQYDQDHQQFLYKMLTKKDSFIRNKLLQTNLTFLNSQLHKYLQDLGLPFIVSFNAQMMAEISRLGRSLQFSNLSNGQKSRVNLALTLCFRDVLMKMHSPINICVLDEALDVGLDSAGIQAAISMLKKKAYDEGTTIFVITHRDEPVMSFNNVLHITMEGDFSVIN
jgi:DNA repair exonuclease SbcCD ATPase subunit